MAIFGIQTAAMRDSTEGIMLIQRVSAQYTGVPCDCDAGLKPNRPANPMESEIPMAKHVLLARD